MSSNDITEIEQLLYRYCFAVDSGTAEAVADLFAEDAVLVPVYTGGAPAHGRGAILEWYVNYKKGTSAAVDHLRHVVSNPAIQVDGDWATAQCYLTSNSVSKATGKAASEDVVVKAINAGSFTALKNFNSGIRASRATGTSTTSMKTINAP